MLDKTYLLPLSPLTASRDEGRSGGFPKPDDGQGGRFFEALSAWRGADESSDQFNTESMSECWVRR